MDSKRYRHPLEGTVALVKTKPEGKGRFMVRMQIPGRLAQRRCIQPNTAQNFTGRGGDPMK